VNSLFCRHNRFTADCPICSKGTVLDAQRERPRPPSTRKAAGSGRTRPAATTGARRVAGPYVSAGPYERDDGSRYEVRLERVPGGVRLAEWAAGALERRAPVLAAADVAPLVAAARERGLLEGRDLDALERALGSPRGEGEASNGFGASPGRSGLLRDELRVEASDTGMVRIARWILRPNAGWELQEAPTMLPAARYAEALEHAVRGGVV
jgi:hypothetical protein